MTDPEKNALEIAEEALDNGYDPFERAQDRGYPETTVTIYWDEVAARKLFDHDKLTSAQGNKVALLQGNLGLVPDLRKAAAGDKAQLSSIQRAVKADTAKLKEVQAEFDRLEAEGLVLKAKVEESAVTIGLRGFANEVTDEIRDKLNVQYPSQDGEPNPAWAKAYNAEIISAAIQWTQRADEAEKNTTPISAATILRWRKSLPEESYLKLTDAVASVTLATGFFKSLEDAGFLAKS